MEKPRSNKIFVGKVLNLCRYIELIHGVISFNRRLRSPPGRAFPTPKMRKAQKPGGAGTP